MKESESFPGKRVGRLTLIKKVWLPSGRYTRGGWLCKCDCGNLTRVRTDYLGKGVTISCGCYNKDHNYANSNHKLHQKYSTSDSQPHSKYTKLYNAWSHIKRRCYSPNDREYSCYGGRGIKMCDEWKDTYQSFKNWSLSHGFHQTTNPHDMTIDRIDVNDNYEPSNCRWVNMLIQNHNRTITMKTVFKGKEIPLKELADDYNLKYPTVRARFIAGKRGQELIKPIRAKKTFGGGHYHNLH